GKPSNKHPSSDYCALGPHIHDDVLLHSPTETVSPAVASIGMGQCGVFHCQIINSGMFPGSFSVWGSAPGEYLSLAGCGGEGEGGRGGRAGERESAAGEGKGGGGQHTARDGEADAGEGRPGPGERRPAAGEGYRGADGDGVAGGRDERIEHRRGGGDPCYISGLEPAAQTLSALSAKHSRSSASPLLPRCSNC
ncbi:hypothetical protein BDZ91DRAFT_809142, partial [Kalaharituber pfeilii]